jgi:cytochrome P450
VARRSGARSALTAQTKQAVRWGLGHALPSTLVRAASRRGDLQGKLIRASRGGDPLPVFEEIRAHGPVYRGRFAYVITSHPLVKAVLASNDFAAGFAVPSANDAASRAFRWADDTAALGPLRPPSLLVTEPPEHTRYRRLVSGVFTPRAVERLRTRTEQVAADLLDRLDGSDPVELVEGYCTLLPVTVIAEILGVPLSERERVLAFGEAAAPSLDFGLGWREFRRVEAALEAFDTWLGEHVAELRRNPGDNLLSQLVAAREDGVGLDERELKATAGLVLAAGFETTVNLLGNAVALLSNHRDQLDALRSDPGLWPNAVEEVLRYDPPVLLTGRSAIRDTVVGDVRMQAGSFVTTLLAAANRDPEVFADPGRFDVTRDNAREHLSFSAGRHFCLGASLARMEGDVGLRLLFERYPDLRTLPGARRRSTRILRGYQRLPVRLGQRAAVATR